MEAEADDFSVFGRGKGDRGLGGEVVGRGVDLGVDDVAGDVERRALGALGGEGRGEQSAAARSERGRPAERGSGERDRIIEFLAAHRDVQFI